MTFFYWRYRVQRKRSHSEGLKQSAEERGRKITQSWDLHQQESCDVFHTHLEYPRYSYAVVYLTRCPVDGWRSRAWWPNQPLLRPVLVFQVLGRNQSREGLPGIWADRLQCSLKTSHSPANILLRCIYLGKRLINEYDQTIWLLGLWGKKK